MSNSDIYCKAESLGAPHTGTGPPTLIKCPAEQVTLWYPVVSNMDESTMLNQNLKIYYNQQIIFKTVIITQPMGYESLK